MEGTTIAVAAIAALAILLIAAGIASSGGSGISTRLERYASGKESAAKATSTARSPRCAAASVARSARAT